MLVKWNALTVFILICAKSQYSAISLWSFSVCCSGSLMHRWIRESRASVLVLLRCIFNANSATSKSRRERNGCHGSVSFRRTGIGVRDGSWYSTMVVIRPDVFSRPITMWVIHNFDIIKTRAVWTWSVLFWKECMLQWIYTHLGPF